MYFVYYVNIICMTFYLNKHLYKLKKLTAREAETGRERRDRQRDAGERREERERE